MKKVISNIGFIFVFLLTITAAQTFAATFTVTKSTNSDDGVCDADCSLREAVFVAQSGDTVVFNSNLIGQTFTLGGTAISFSGKRIEIDGDLDGVNVVFLSGSNTSHHFNVGTLNAVTGLTLRNMILAQGDGGLAGSLQVNDASLILDRVAIRGNTARNAGAIYAFNQSTTSITNSSITGNTTTGELDGAEIAAIFGQTMYMSNTTVSNNRSLGTQGNNDAGTIYGVDVFLRNCTITDNEAIRGGGISVSDTANSLLDIGNTIIAGNTASVAGQDIAFIFGGTAANILSRGGNLIGDVNNLPGGIFNQTNDAVNLNALLAPTNSNQGGHPVFTHPLQAGSPALNTGINSLAVHPLGNMPLAQDARGIDFPRLAGATVDKGAFEDQSLGSTLVVSKLANSNDNVCDTDCSLREAVFAASQDPGTDNITMAANVFGTMIVGSEIQINNHDVNIIGYPSIGSDTLIVSGNNVSRVFRCENANVTMTGFTIANGTGAGQSQPFGGGGMLFSSGNLTLNQMIIRNNATVASDLGSGGGLVVVSGSVVRIMNSTFNNNSSYSSMAGSIDAAVTYITNTTITNNSYLAPGEPGFGALSVGGTLYMRNTTIANNRSPNSPTGSGLFCGGSSICNLGNNIFSDNLATNGNDLFVSPGGDIQSVGGNLVENLTGFDNSEFNQPNDILGVDPVLGALADNGGSVTTLALGAGSPAANRGLNANAIDPFSSAPLVTDARGSGFSRILGPIVDKGAFEQAGPTAASVSVSGRVIAGKGGVPNALVTITDMNGNTQTVRTSSFGQYQFTGIQAGQSYVVSVSAKQFQFGSHGITPTDDLADLDFYAVE